MADSKTAFLMAMSKGQAVSHRLPSWLLSEATRALRGMPGLVQPDDVVQAFLESICLDGTKRRASVPWHLLSEVQASGLVRHRMRQLACEMADGWNYHRAIRSHVDAALRTGLPPAPAELPFSLCDGDRLSRPLVASAAAWMVAEEVAEASTKRLTRALKNHYSLQPMLAANDEPLEATDLDAEGPDDQLEAQRLAQQLVDSLGPDAARVFGRRLCDHKLQQLSRETGLSVTSVFEREKKATTLARQVLVASGCSRAVARSALRRLTEAVA